MINVRKEKAALIFISAFIFVAAIARADTIYLKNGRSVEGIIEKESADAVEINMGFGTITFARSQIKDMKRASIADSRIMAEKWAAQKKELEAKEKEFQDARDKRFKDAYENSLEDALHKRSEDGGEPKEIRIARDQSTRAIVIETLLNGKVKANLVLDTGASIITLSRRIGEELNLDLSDNKKDVMELRLADGSRTKAKAIVLESVKVQAVEVRNVMAAVMLEEVPSIGIKDGLLGMSFLSKFNLNVDLESMKMSLEKIEK